MYCRTCGVENPDSSNYCMNDGTILKKEAPLQLAKDPARFCAGCGHPLERADNYCPQCGTSQFSYTAGAGSNDRLPVSTDTGTRQVPGFSLRMVKRVLAPVVLAFAVMLILSGIVALSSHADYQSFVKGLEDISAGGVAEMPDIVEHVFIYSYQNIVLSSHLGHPIFSANMDGGDTVYKVDFAYSIHFWVWLLIPMISAFAAGIFYFRKNRPETLSGHVYAAGLISVFYTVLMYIFSLFSHYSYKKFIFDAELHFKMHESVLSLLLGSLIIVFLFSILGMLFAGDYRHFTKHLAGMMPFGEEIHQAVRTFVSAGLILSVISVLYTAIKLKHWLNQFPEAASILKVSTGDMAKSVVLAGSQIGAYLMGLLHFAPIHLTFELDGKGSLVYSLLGGLKGTGKWAAFPLENPVVTDGAVWLWVTLIIPVALFILAGWQLREAGSGVSYRSIAVFSFAYSLCMLLLVAAIRITATGSYTFTDVNYSGKEGASLFLSIGFQPFLAFVTSYIFSFLFVLLGTLLHRGNKRES